MLIMVHRCNHTGNLPQSLLPLSVKYGSDASLLSTRGLFNMLSLTSVSSRQRKIIMVVYYWSSHATETTNVYPPERRFLFAHGTARVLTGSSLPYELTAIDGIVQKNKEINEYSRQHVALCLSTQVYKQAGDCCDITNNLAVAHMEFQSVEVSGAHAGVIESVIVACEQRE